MRDAVNCGKSGRLHAILASQHRLAPLAAEIVDHVIGYDASKESMTLRRAILDQVFDGWRMISRMYSSGVI